MAESGASAGSRRRERRRELGSKRSKRNEPKVSRAGSTDQSKLGFLDAEAQLLRRCKKRFEAELQTLRVRLASATSFHYTH